MNKQILIEQRIDFVSLAIDADIVDIDLIRSRIMRVSSEEKLREIVKARLARIISKR
jgi:hypothetical protein